MGSGEQQAQAERLVCERGLQDAIRYAAKISGLKQKPKIQVKNKNPMYQFMELWKSQTQMNLNGLTTVNWL